jgi:hypothetical protein
MIPKVYVRAKSKAELNRRLREENVVRCTEYTLLTDGIEFHLGADVPDGTQVALFTKIQNGFPYAHSFGVYNYNKNQVQ